MNDIDRRLQDTGRAFLAAAWARLQEERVVPPPAFHPYLEVGRDYFGNSVMPLAEYRALEEAIAASHPRFDAGRPLHEREFPGGLVFSFLETFIARLTRAREDFSPDGPAAEQALRDLIQAVHADTYEVACCRVVSHMTTADGKPVEFTNIRVEPVISQAADHDGELQRIISTVIPGAASAYGRDRPHGFAPPESVIIAQDSGAKPFDLAKPLSQRIERFMLLVRLLKPSTSESMAEIQGATHTVREFKPTVLRFRGAGPGFGSPTQLAARVITLGSDDVSRVDGLGRLLTAAEQPRTDMAFTSFGMALQKFVLSFHAYGWSEQIVDLATAFEAALSGKEKTDVTLRLKIRASTLLSTAVDPTEQIFNDVGVIYGLRSTLVHGGAMTEKALLKEVRKISTVPDGLPDGTAIAHAVERLRDLVRRSLLARICLAVDDTPLWPLNADTGVDAAMVDDLRRKTWREAWRDTLTSIDALASADPPLA
ncbi:HEPN domain-containing protein [Streptomyces sp. P17]|uniref:HEPN domain-containing protein n=1 Tax=Streptomyces sp. P17 TaxID=3074716 RepID=UPI0028F41BC7|nr:HEPN domain-containing protein [Streptomyces sp. P17]MDT9700279.1 HEPN domain-containing protein [Streptomyces sp. P17]